MYKVFVNRLIINLTSDKEFLNDSKTYLLSSISIKEIIKKLKIHDEVFLYYPDEKKLLVEIAKIVRNRWPKKKCLGARYFHWLSC